MVNKYVYTNKLLSKNIFTKKGEDLFEELGESRVIWLQLHKNLSIIGRSNEGHNIDICPKFEWYY